VFGFVSLGCFILFRLFYIRVFVFFNYL